VAGVVVTQNSLIVSKTQGETQGIFPRNAVQTIHSRKSSLNIQEEARHGMAFKGLLNRYFK